MSLLEQLQKKRLTLQSTTTVITTPTGERYIENSASALPPMKLKERSHGFVVDTKPDTIPACILKDFLYLGSQDAVSVDNIKTYKLTHILSVGIPTPDIDASDMHVLFEFLPCLDLPETELFGGVAQKAAEFIENARSSGGRVLVHCNAGVSRAASVVIAYLLLKQDMKFDEAYALVKMQRACIQPNAGFIKELKSFKKCS